MAFSTRAQCCRACSPSARSRRAFKISGYSVACMVPAYVLRPQTCSEQSTLRMCTFGDRLVTGN